MSVVGATVGAFKEHPLIWGGVLVGAVAVVWLASRGSSTPAPQSFNFSYGPSDAQVMAGTALQIAQVQANASSAVNASHDALAQTVEQDYFGYLTNNSANGLSATQDALASAVAINGQNVGGASFVAGLNLQGLVNTNATQAAIASNNNTTALTGLINTNAAKVQISTDTNAAAVTINQANNNTAWNTVVNNNQTALQAQTADIYGKALLQQTATAGQIAVINAQEPYVMAQLSSNERIAANAQAISAQEYGVSGLVSATQAGDQVSIAQAQAGALKRNTSVSDIISGVAGAVGIASLL